MSGMLTTDLKYTLAAVGCVKWVGYTACCLSIHVLTWIHSTYKMHPLRKSLESGWNSERLLLVNQGKELNLEEREMQQSLLTLFNNAALKKAKLGTVMAW